MWDVVGVGANSLDVVYVLPEQPRVDALAKLPILSHRLSPGGQVATALSTCAAMGLSTAYIGTFGTDQHADLVRGALETRGVHLSLAHTREAPNPFAVILIGKTEGERIVLWRREPAVSLAPTDVRADAIRAARLVHVDDVDEDAAIHAASAARAAGVPVTSDIEKVTPRTMDLIAAVSVPIFGEGVVETLTGEADTERALRTLRGRHAGLLVSTLGARGAVLLEGDRLHRVAGHDVPVVDTTGAGDVFRGAFIAAHLRGETAEVCLQFANAAAALSCTRLGAIASVPTLDEVTSLLGTGSWRRSV